MHAPGPIVIRRLSSDDAPYLRTALLNAIHLVDGSEPDPSLLGDPSLRRYANAAPARCR
ncbi:MAG: hypothetical protein ACLFUA_14100 [Spirochaetales bacterium]